MAVDICDPVASTAISIKSNSIMMNKDISHSLRSILPLEGICLTATAWHTASQVVIKLKLELQMLELAKIAVAVAVMPPVL